MPKDAAYQAICSEVAERLRAERLRQNLSLAAVAARAGLSYQMVGYVEQGKRIPGLDTLLRISDALGVDPSALIRNARKMSWQVEARAIACSSIPEVIPGKRPDRKMSLAR